LSWNNTVTCSWCYTTGHNRSSCSERKQHIADRPDSYEAQRDHERRNRGRRCSYCEGHGHTRRTCANKKEDRKNLLIKNKQLRAEAYEHFCTEGLAPGTLFTMNHWNRGKVAAMVNRLQWERIRVDNGFTISSFRTGHGAFIVYTQLSTGDNGHIVGMGEIEQIVSPVSSDAVSIGMPKGWLDSTDEQTIYALDELQKERTSGYVRQHYLEDA